MCGVQQPTPFHGSLGEQIVHHGRERAAHPGAQGRVERRLRPVDDVVWQVSRGRALEQMLLGVAANAVAGRQREHPFHHAVIDERRARLDTGGHCRLVRVGQIVLRQKYLRVVPAHPGQVREVGLCENRFLCAPEPGFIVVTAGEQAFELRACQREIRREVPLRRRQ